MKTLLKSAAMISGLLFTAGLMAQATTTPAKPATTSAKARPATQPATMQAAAPAKAVTWTALDVKKMTTDLALTNEQVPKLTELNTRFEKDHQMLVQEGAKMTPEQTNARLASLEQRRTREVKALLTPEQLKKWEGTAATQATPAAPATRTAPPPAKEAAK